MSFYSDLEEFVQAHRPHGYGVYEATPATPAGYRVTVGCPCGVTFERWVLPQDAAEDLLAEASALLQTGSSEGLTT